MTGIAVAHTVTWMQEEWLRLEALGEVRYSPGQPLCDADLLARIDDAQIVVGALVPFTGRVGTGYIGTRSVVIAAALG